MPAMLFKVGSAASTLDTVPTMPHPMLPLTTITDPSTSHAASELEVLSESLHRLRKKLQVDVYHAVRTSAEPSSAEKLGNTHTIQQRAQEYLRALQPLCIARSTSEARPNAPSPPPAEHQTDDQFSSLSFPLTPLSPVCLWLAESLSAALAHADALEALASQHVTVRPVTTIDLCSNAHQHSTTSLAADYVACTPPLSMFLPSRRSIRSVEPSVSMLCSKHTPSHDEEEGDLSCNSVLGAPMQRMKRAQADGDDAFETINDYLILQQLGRGAAGVVSLAVHQHTERVVAIKSMVIKVKPKADRAASRLRALSSIWTPNGENLLHPPTSHHQPAVNLDGAEHHTPPPRKSSAAAEAVRPAQEMEIDIMRKLQHPNIVQLFEVVDDDDDDAVHLVMEYCHKGPCIRPLPAAVLHRADRKSSAETPLPMCDTPVQPRPSQTMTVVRPLHRLVKFSRQIAKALRYIHRYRILHRDIKPDNLLVDEHDNIKVSDFGVSHVIASLESNINDDEGGGAGNNGGSNLSALYCQAKADHCTTLRGTPAFLAPEVLHDCTAATAASDVWSFGVTLYAMMFGRLPFVGDTLREQMEAILSAPLEFPPLEEVPEREELNSETYELWTEVLRGLLCRNPGDRMTLHSLLRHRFMLGISHLVMPLSSEDSHSITKSSSGFDIASPMNSSGGMSEANGNSVALVVSPPQPPDGPSSNSPHYARRILHDTGGPANLAESNASPSITVEGAAASRNHPPPSFMQLPELPHTKRSFHRVVVVSDKKRKSLVDAMNLSHVSEEK